MIDSEMHIGNKSGIMPRHAELQILAKIAASIGRNHSVLPSNEVTGFMAMQGKYYNRQLMVVGRAVNGWTKKTWTPESLASDENVQEFVACVLRSVTASESCPMQWVSKAWGNRTTERPSNWVYHGNQEYDSQKSAFWRVIRNVVGKLELADVGDDAWPSCLIWSNLYKISPATGGNPTGKLASLQRDNCISLLETELRVYKPRRMLFLTGYDLASPFLKQLAPNVTSVRGSYVQAIGTSAVDVNDACTVVVAKHPQTKLELSWVKEVFQAFQAMSGD